MTPHYMGSTGGKKMENKRLKEGNEMSRMNGIFRFFMLIMLIMVLPMTIALAQTGKIAGTVTDAETGQPLPGANVVVEGTQSGAAADQDGHYFIINLDPETYAVTASVIGYQQVTKTDVEVSTGHTTTLNFRLESTAIAGEAITVEAEVEVVRMDESASTVSVKSEEITETATIRSVEEYINTQAGVEGMNIRGGGLDETRFMVDGLSVVDNRTNQPVMMVNLSAIEELNIIKGGFQPEYGNLRSGLINVVTKSASPSRYNGSLDYRYTPPHLKHSGASVLNRNNFWLRPYLDPGVAMVGTQNGTWSEEEQAQNLQFRGWEAVSEDLMSDADPSNDMTPEEAQQQFIWRHAMEGSDSLGQKARNYGHKPDWLADVSFGGPVPLVSDYLGNLAFFFSHKDDWEMFGMLTSRDYFIQQNSQLKLTSRISDAIKLSVEGIYGEVHTVAQNPENPIMNPTDWDLMGDAGHIYSPQASSPWDIHRSMQGISLDHVLSNKTFYNLRISRVFINHWANGPTAYRDTTTLRYFGSFAQDETPWGYGIEYDKLRDDKQIGGGGLSDEYNWSENETYNVKFDMTSQFDRYNQVKFGFEVNYDDIHTNWMRYTESQKPLTRSGDWRVFPYMISGYMQDKLEFEGMIANFGVRVDYSTANTDWYLTDDKYSEYYTDEYRENFTDVAPTAPTKDHLKVSPRLGISHPISERSKLYFNYGHFYSRAPSRELFRIYKAPNYQGIGFLGNPSADLPRTVSYELGVDTDIGYNMLLHVAGYYKDVNSQTGTVTYTNYTGLVDYSTVENNNYEDIRGFEVRLERRFGRWISGWLNYTYRVSTSGYVGREHYYEDPRQQMLYGLQNPRQFRPLARPVARANVRLTTPPDFGPRFGGMRLLANWRFGLLFNYRAGQYYTWDPLNTYELTNNIQWRPSYNFDARISKTLAVSGVQVQLFADIQNVFDIKNLTSLAFEDGVDRENYFKSLHLPMYEGEEYQNLGMEPGDDAPGDIKSEDKPYIDMPNINYLRYLNPRVATFGIKVNF